MGIIVLGSTGSIGVQTLDCIENLGLSVSAMCAGRNFTLFEKQIRKFMPQAVAMSDEDAANKLKDMISDLHIPVFSGEEGVLRLFEETESDICVNGIVGVAGLRPTVAAAKKGMRIALANKESLVVAGDEIKKLCRNHGAEIIPVDSEHSAVFQCLNGICPTDNDIQTIPSKIRRLILTASGGAFYGKTNKDLSNVTAADALLHPTWKMGKKITVDCATLMNKGFEIIEAAHLFDISEEKIDVVIHRESIIHSMIEFNDSSVLAQMSYPDMRIAIQYALTYPERKASPVDAADFTSLPPLTFSKPDFDTFRAPILCREVLRSGGSSGAILNASNEIAVDAFLSNRIPFLRITDFVEKMLGKYAENSNPSIEELIEIDKKIRAEEYPG
ncbi:MAG: 1-deoxy-D-xylulose-5-phosphate reductoisomerase [Clostridia bacterium]|nr:1-deoxy-D-xylulose-5-phosphate reductoisomerase [Clostridia bacterium]